MGNYDRSNLNKMAIMLNKKLFFSYWSLSLCLAFFSPIVIIFLQGGNNLRELLVQVFQIPNLGKSESGHQEIQ